MRRLIFICHVLLHSNVLLMFTCDVMRCVAETKDPKHAMTEDYRERQNPQKEHMHGSQTGVSPHLVNTDWCARDSKPRRHMTIIAVRNPELDCYLLWRLSWDAYAYVHTCTYASYHRQVPSPHIYSV